jgi:hypothetical protein
MEVVVMVGMSLALLLVVGIVMVMIGMATAGLLRKERALDERLHEPDAATVTWTVPPGVDPVIVGAALTAEGFATVVEDHGEVLRIECLLVEHEDVRAIVERVCAEEYAPALALPPVVFREDPVA